MGNGASNSERRSGSAAATRTGVRKAGKNGLGGRTARDQREGQGSGAGRGQNALKTNVVTSNVVTSRPAEVESPFVIPRHLSAKNEIVVREPAAWTPTVICYFLPRHAIGRDLVLGPVQGADGRTITVPLCAEHASPSWTAQCITNTCQHCGRQVTYRPTARQRRFCCHTCRVLGRKAALRAMQQRSSHRRDSRGAHA
jgi:hypothetical protein